MGVGGFALFSPLPRDSLPLLSDPRLNGKSAATCAHVCVFHVYTATFTGKSVPVAATVPKIHLNLVWRQELKSKKEIRDEILLRGGGRGAWEGGRERERRA